MEVNKLIKQRRLELNLTLKDLAEALNVAVSTVSRYETSDIQNMGIDKIEKLAEILQCTPAYLMGWENDKNLVLGKSNIGNNNLVHGNNNNLIQGNKSSVTVASKALSEIEKSELETELINIFRELTVREKTDLLSYAYNFLDKK